MKYVRVDNAGHDVPSYQPRLGLEMYEEFFLD